MAENGPGSFWKVPEVSGQYHRCPNTLILGGQGTQGAGQNLEGSHPKEDCNPLWGRIPLVGGFLLGVGVP